MNLVYQSVIEKATPSHIAVKALLDSSANIRYVCFETLSMEEPMEGKKGLNEPAFFSKIRFLNAAQLKWIAMISMLLDHIDKGILTNLIVLKNYSPWWITAMSSVFGILGRIAFPIFLFLLVEGYLHTRNRRNYLLYLLGFGILAEVPYDMFETGTFYDSNCQNMYFTLALALATLWLIGWIRTKLPKIWILFAIAIGIASGFIASLLALDYHFYGILIPILLYIFIDFRIIGSGLSYLLVLKDPWCCLGFLTINVYNGERGKINKWFCYLFYPIHMLIIGLIRIYLIQ